MENKEKGEAVEVFDKPKDLKLPSEEEIRRILEEEMKKLPPDQPRCGGHKLENFVVGNQA